MRLKIAAWMLLAGCFSPVWAAALDARPQISIIIDDMGDRSELGRRALALPGAVAFAMLPGTPHGREQAKAAHAAGKEVLLHFPLEPTEGKPHPLAVTTRSSREQLIRRLREDLAQLPHVVGVNIHQGSRLSQRGDYMNWMMAELSVRPDLYFVDSYTTAASVAETTARNWRLATTRRHVFLDDSIKEADIAHQFQRLIRKARRDGRAVAIGHPYPETLAVLERELKQLDRYQVRLVAPSEQIRAHLRQHPLPRNQPVQLRLATQMVSASVGPDSSSLAVR